ncbi:MAG TPA: type IV toxin-antitoxin system AbiEi family antitoxin domain-containing protein [Polyangiaceae bacterium]
MPRRAAAGTQPDWNRLYELASSQAGYFTAKEAAESGFSLPLLQHHLDAGRIERSQRGVFRLVNFPPTDEEGLVPTWLWSRREGTFSHETALALHQLSDALPAKLHLTVPTVWRKRRIQIPRNVVLYFTDLGEDEREWKGPIRVTKPLRTVADCSLDAVAKDLVEQAVRQGVRRGLFTRQSLKLAMRRLDGGRQSGAA